MLSHFSVMRVTAMLMILINIDVALGALLAAGYALATAVTAAGAFGAATAEIVARLMPGDTSNPPALPQ